jgi:YVTN family beta-propeller protein
MSAHEIWPCGSGAPYALDYNYTNRRFYAACALGGNVDAAAVYAAGPGGLSRITTLAVGQGGANGGGGLAADPATGNVFFTNSLDDTVSVISGASNAVIATVRTGDDPFGVAVNTRTRNVYVGHRAGDNIGAFPDIFAGELPAGDTAFAPQTPTP